jgi:hypothetical protein
MAVEAFDVDGNPIEGLVAPEEVKIIQDKLSKLENKDLNFRKLESMTEDEKNKLTAVELSLKQQAEDLDTKQKTFEIGFVSDIKNDLLESISNGDEELKKKIELNYARLKGADEVKTRSEISELMRDAYKLSVQHPSSNSLNRAVNFTGQSPAKSSSSDISNDVIVAGKMMGLSDEDFKKYNK